MWTGPLDPESKAIDTVSHDSVNIGQECLLVHMAAGCVMDCHRLACLAVQSAIPLRPKTKVEDERKPSQNQKCEEASNHCMLQHMLTCKVVDGNDIDGHQKKSGCGGDYWEPLLIDELFAHNCCRVCHCENLQQTSFCIACEHSHVQSVCGSEVDCVNTGVGIASAEEVYSFASNGLQSHIVIQLSMLLTRSNCIHTEHQILTHKSTCSIMRAWISLSWYVINLGSAKGTCDLRVWGQRGAGQSSRHSAIHSRHPADCRGCACKWEPQRELVRLQCCEWWSL